jgi:hypothetical protein
MMSPHLPSMYAMQGTTTYGLRHVHTLPARRPILRGVQYISD